MGGIPLGSDKSRAGTGVTVYMTRLMSLNAIPPPDRTGALEQRPDQPVTTDRRPALILIDIQQGFDDLSYWGGERNNPDAETKAGELLRLWRGPAGPPVRFRQNGWPVFHVRHDSTTPGSRLAPGQAGNAFQDVVAPLDGEPVIPKNVNSAFIGTDLQQRLDEQGIRQVVLAGLTTDHCVSTTARMAGNLGYDVIVVSDATATFAKTGVDGQHFSAQVMHETALASLNGEFATVLTVSQLKEFLQTNKL